MSNLKIYCELKFGENNRFSIFYFLLTFVFPFAIKVYAILQN